MSVDAQKRDFDRTTVVRMCAIKHHYLGNASTENYTTDRNFTPFLLFDNVILC